MNFSVEVKEDVAGIALVQGFKVAGVACDIRNKSDLSRLDLSLIVSEKPAVSAGVFTTNDLKAAPVLVDMQHLSSTDKVKAIVANSGNANACTAEQGMEDAKKMCKLVADKLGVPQEEVLVCSTGRIGEFMPMAKIEDGITKAYENLGVSDEHSTSAADAILTSDTRNKTVLATVKTPNGEFKVVGMAKGAGMIEPNMATMLAFIASDAQVDALKLKEILKRVSDKSFNRITVDGDMSTNDTVLCMCNAESSVRDDEALEAGILEVCRVLARKIVSDGEKITKVIELVVEGARDEAQAEAICRAIGNSLLVKASWFGCDPNWGRLVDAAGYARTGLDFSKVDLYYDDVEVLIGGKAKVENKPEWKQIVSKKVFKIRMNLNIGQAMESILSSDLTDGYVNFNKSE